MAAVTPQRPKRRFDLPHVLIAVAALLGVVLLLVAHRPAGGAAVITQQQREQRGDQHQQQSTVEIQDQDEGMQQDQELELELEQQQEEEQQQKKQRKTAPRHQEGPVAPAWEGKPDWRMAVQLPSWAGCRNTPCQYTSMVNGDVDESVPMHSQFGEDAWLYNNLFYRKRNGFYLEMGAYDGVLMSNTLYFQQAAGWRGLLIEADPGLFGFLVVNRAESICVHAAACAKAQEVHWVDNAYNTGGIWEFMASSYRKLYHKGRKVEEMPVVACVPLMDILDNFGIDTIDLWSLDVEGAELEVLSTVDFSRLDVKVMMVELDGHDKGKDQKVRDLLAAAGMEAVPSVNNSGDLTRYNTVFVRKDAWPQLEHAPNIAKVVLE